MADILKAAERDSPMTAKEFLQQYQDADHEINAKLDQIYKLRTLAAKTTSAFAPDRVQSSGPVSKLENIVARIADMENEVDDAIDRLQDTKRQVEVAIAAVPDSRQRAVLTRRYINGLRWEEIAVQMNYDYSWVLRLHGDGLQVVENTRLKTT